MNYKTDILIVGAGISGLMAANYLSQAGQKLIIVDKGRGVGGRMATRRMGSGRADHGAQFFTARSDVFKQHVSQWLDECHIFQWATGWSDDPAQDAKDDGYPRYAGATGMTAVPKAVAANHNIYLNCRLIRISAVHDQWHATDSNQNEYIADKLILTPPVPQSLALLNAGQVPLEKGDQNALEQIRYTPCLAGIFLIDGAVALPKPGALQRPHHAYSWIANNQQKGISPFAQLVTIHANADLSWQYWDASQEEKIAMLHEGLRPFLTNESVIKEAQAHRWRYAQPITLHPYRTLVAQKLPPLAFAGDGFKEARVEGAALSGLAAAQAILDHK